MPWVQLNHGKSYLSLARSTGEGEACERARTDVAEYEIDVGCLGVFKKFSGEDAAKPAGGACKNSEYSRSNCVKCVEEYAGMYGSEATDEPVISTTLGVTLDGIVEA